MSFVLEVVEQYSVEALMLKMKFQQLGHLMWRASSLEEALMLGKIVGRRRGINMMRWWDGITDSMDMSLRKLHKIVKDREACFAAIYVITKSQTWLSNWTTPMRTEGPVKTLALVGVNKDLGKGEASHSLVQVPESKARSTRYWMCYQTLFSKKIKKTVFCMTEIFDWVFALDYAEGCGRKLGWAKSAKTRWPAAGGQGMW